MIRSSTRLLICIIAMCVLQGGVALAEPSFPQDAIEGTWLTDEGRFRVVISSCDRARDEAEGDLEYCGTIVWARPFTEAEQREFGKNGEPFDPAAAVGSEALMGFVHDGSDQWKGGKFYVKARDKSYGASLRLRSESQLDVTIRAAFVFRKTVRWTRIEVGDAPEPPGPPEGSANRK